MAKERAHELLYEAELLTGELDRRRREEKLRYYRPHEKQEQFHRCLKKNRWALGGNRTGKTEAGAAESVYLARGNHPYRETNGPMDGWVVSLTAEMQRDVAQKKLMSYIDPEWIRSIRMREGRADDPLGGIIDYIQIECVHGGVSTIGFKNCAQGREKFQGTSQDFIWFDEEPPEDIYQECLMRTLDNGGLIFGTMTPLKGLTWVYNTIFLNEANDPEVWYITMSWEDNPHLSEEAVRQMTLALSEEELSARRHGRFVAISGLVYGEFDESVHVIEPFDVPREWQDMISIDPGFTKPLSCHWYAADHEGNVYVI
ncbi:MAG: terminase family protein, partial [Clostridia bacterium]|nr:terminase family protein [Clostridia bacterium]